MGVIRVPVGGGSYFRLLPAAVWLGLLREVEKRRPLMIYVHPWECDPLTPRLPLGMFPGFVTDSASSWKSLAKQRAAHESKERIDLNLETP